MQHFFRKTTWNDQPILRPLHDDDREWLRKQKEGKQIKGDMRTTRNPEHHKKAFAMFKLVMDNHPKYNTIDDVLLEFKLRAGHYQEHIRAGNSRSANELRRMANEQLDGQLRSDVLRAVENLEREAKLVYMPKSISFDNMGQEEFEKLYEAWIPIACDMIGVKDEELRAELAQF